ncbi:PEP/pyruvate-binding domain-containing protein [Alkalicoccus luteus]|uniref:Pyruvate, phosphate dikinase n=1 Tax=Alkalicoccus luteus TaxID=1237094 RepID=A0A969PQC5_9BACI|nr:PEP/pyruvate-binding domain-containing protein [Alkalicoccus luteus]NJP38427.1 pyruvate, phosphate dikinase [Alkalicoccus luteus]
MIHSFDSSHTWSLKEAGGKGLNLVNMVKAGLPVPPGFIISTAAYRQFMSDYKLENMVQNELFGIDPENVHQLEQKASWIQQSIMKHEVPQQARASIMEAQQKLGDMPLAVRSSATAEDLPDLSFAGQHDSNLDIEGEEQLMESIKRCWASLWNARAISYRIHHGISHHPDELALAVVVQVMVESEKSGVLFTVNPLTNRRDQLLVNAAWGMGEGVVSGKVTPDTYILSKENGRLITAEIAKKQTKIIRTKTGPQKADVPYEEREQACLSKEELEQLYTLAKAVNKYDDRPQDTEWVIGDGNLFIVQARPVTSLHETVSPPDPPEKGLRLYLSFTRVSQGISIPFTPLGLDVQRLEMKGALHALGYKQAYADTAFKTAEGRIYWDCTEVIRNKKRAFNIADSLSLKDPGAEKLLKQFVTENEQELQQQKSGLYVPFKLAAVGGRLLIRAIAASVQPHLAEKRQVQLAHKHLQAMMKVKQQAGSRREKLEAVHTIMDEAMRIILHQCAYIVPGLSAEKRAKKRTALWLEDSKLLNPVLHALPNSPTTQMGKRLVEIAAAYDEAGMDPDPEHRLIQEFLEEYGHRSTTELDIGIPRWYEDTAYLLQLIESYREQGAAALSKKLDEQAAYARVQIELLKREAEKHKGKQGAKKLERDCLHIRRLLGLRERPKFDLIRSFALVRQLMMEIGEELEQSGNLHHKEDVFFLKLEELYHEEASFLETVASRKKRYNKQRQRKSVPRFMTSTGECLYESTTLQQDGALQGNPISSGETEGTVRVLTEPAEARLNPGEILVTHSTDPSWTPLFLTAGGLVMETGGSGSHGGIVAREYGIPAVAGIENVSEKLQTGDRVRLNGTTGTVQVLASASAYREEHTGS